MGASQAKRETESILPSGTSRIASSKGGETWSAETSLPGASNKDFLGDFGARCIRRGEVPAANLLHK